MVEEEEAVAKEEDKDAANKEENDQRLSERQKQPTDNEEETEAAKKMERPRMSRVFGLGQHPHHHQSLLSIKDTPSIVKKKII